MSSHTEEDKESAMRDSIESYEAFGEPERIPQEPRPLLRLVPAARPAEGRWTLFWRSLRTRKALLRLNSYQLRDIGLSRADALAEADKPLWTLWREAGRAAQPSRD